MWPDRVSDPGPLALRGPVHDDERKYEYRLSELMLLSIMGRGGMGIRTTNGKIHIRHKTYISARKHAQLMIKGYQVQIQPTPSPLHCDLEYFHRIPSTSVCVCVCVCACACVCM